MSRYDDALALLRQADAGAAAALEAVKTSGDPAAGFAGFAGAIMSVFVAQVHATLALVDAQRDAQINESDIAP